MEYLILSIQTLIAIAIINLMVFYYKYREFPPGPWGLPYFGCAPFVGSNPRAYMQNLSIRYGRIFSVNLWNEQMVVVTDWNCINEVLDKQSDNFGLPPLIHNFHCAFLKQVANQENEEATSIEIVKKLGLESPSSSESVVIAEVNNLAEYLKNLDGQLIDVSSVFILPLINVMRNMCSGKTFDLTVATHKAFTEALEIGTSNGNVVVLDACSSSSNFAAGCNGYKRFAEALKLLFHCMEKVAEHKIESHEHQNEDKTDSTHCFMEEIEKCQKDELENCEAILSDPRFDVLAAGMEIMDTYLFWAVILMAKFPEIQEKVYKELEKMFTIDSQISFSSRKQMPYTEATICEIGRFVSISPFATPRSATRSLTLLDYTIPKGTTILASLLALDHDKEYWVDPENLRPERFLDEEGQLKVHERFIPFSSGPRACLIKPFAEMQLLLFFSCMMRRFSFHDDPNQQNPKFLHDAYDGNLMKSRPHSLIVKSRVN